jgi:nicotinate-nucleotide pyrophosphorylase (carboxylating)
MTIVRLDAPLVVGSGVAGLSVALGLPRAVVLTLGPLGSTGWAQGGIAAALGSDDAPSLHAEDTMTVSAGLAVREAVDALTAGGPEAIRRLVEIGARFDLDASGDLSLAQEAGHRRRRIVHADGDATGREIMRALTEATAASPAVEVLEGWWAVDLARHRGRVTGVAAETPDGDRVVLLAPAVILATGGIGRLYRHTTNPPGVTGDGLAMAARAGARLADLEFVQFHPTALLASGVDPLPLLTEALRGEGATLVDRAGRRFMTLHHPDAELAPRDVVARAIWWQRQRDGAAYLDARSIEDLPERFPTVFGLTRDAGLDPRTDLLPVTPAAHYFMGGIDAGPDGRTSLPGLWAVGEVAATGVHGANRLASNSLLEGLVFGAAVAADVAGSRPRCRTRGRCPTVRSSSPAGTTRGRWATSGTSCGTGSGWCGPGPGCGRPATGCSTWPASCAPRSPVGSPSTWPVWSPRRRSAGRSPGAGTTGPTIPTPTPSRPPATWWSPRPSRPTCRRWCDARPDRRRPAAPGTGRGPRVGRGSDRRSHARPRADLPGRGGGPAGGDDRRPRLRSPDLPARRPGHRRRGPGRRRRRGRAGTVLAEVTGPARGVLTAERTALNLLGHLSGIATATAGLVAAVAGTGARIADTRKTTPGLRALEKYAVRMGGGVNHRFGLHDAVLVKDNHLAAAGGIRPALAAVRDRAGHLVKIEVEVTSLDQLAELLEVGADVVLLDNMDRATMRRAVEMVDGRMVIEASGGITLDSVRAVAETGVDLISVGWITHSAPRLDVALDVV